MSKLIEKTRSGTLWQGMSQLSLAVSGYIIAVILARQLGPAEFGVYSIIYTFLMAIELIVPLGIPGAVSRLTAEGRDADGKLRGTGLGIILITCCVAFVALWLLASLIAGWLGIPAAATLIRIAVLDVPCFGAYFLVAQILNGRRDFAGQSTAAIAYSLTKVVGTTLLAMTELTIAGALIVNIIASLVGLALVTMRAGVPRIALQAASAAPILQLAAPVAAIAFGTQVLLNIDLWFIGAAGAGAGEAVGGYYAAAKNLARMPNLIAFVMNAVLIPSIAHAIATGDPELARRIMRGSMRFLALTLLPGCALLAVKAEPLMALLFSQEYAAGKQFLQLLLLANGLLHTLCAILITILVATRHQRHGAAVALFATLPAISLNYLLVPTYGPLGAALSACCAAGIAVLAASAVTYRLLGSFIDGVALLKICIATAIACAIEWFVPFEGMLVLVTLIGAAVCFLGLCFALRVVTRDDLLILQGRPAAPKTA